MANFNPSDMELTPAKVYFTPAGSTTEVYLGGTLSNVKIQIATEKAPIKADQTGTYVLDNRLSGGKYTVQTEIAQSRDFSLLAYLFPSATAGASGIEFINNVGHSDLEVAGQLRLHPQDLDDNDDDYDFVFYKATPTEASEITYGPTEQSRFKVEWMIFPDTTYSPFKFFRRGATSF